MAAAASPEGLLRLLKQGSVHDRSPAIQRLHKAQLAVIAAQRLSNVKERYSVLSAADEAAACSSTDLVGRARIEPTPSAPAEEYELHELLGRGGFGTVHRATLASGEAAAVKVIDMTIAHAHDTLYTEDYLLREVEVHQELTHPHVLKLFSSSVANGKLTLVLELCSGPDLQTVLKARGAMSEGEAKRVTFQLVDALSYLHGRRIVHRDLKPANVMLRDALPDLVASPLGARARSPSHTLAAISAAHHVSRLVSC